jgi:hypothetical protein
MTLLAADNSRVKKERVASMCLRLKVLAIYNATSKYGTTCMPAAEPISLLLAFETSGADLGPRLGMLQLRSSL